MQQAVHHGLKAVITLASNNTSRGSCCLFSIAHALHWTLCCASMIGVHSDRRAAQNMGQATEATVQQAKVATQAKAEKHKPATLWNRSNTWAVIGLYTISYQCRGPTWKAALMSSFIISM